MVFFARRGMARRLPSPLIGVCAAWLVTGCGSLDRGLLEDLVDDSGRGKGGGHHPGGHGGAAGGGGEGPVGQSCGGLISGDDLYAAIANDLAGLDAEDAPFTRYLSLANQANANGCGPVLDVARAALDKLVNSVSLSPTLAQPIAVDANETLYRIDLRDYDWDRTIAVDGTSFPDAWEAIIASSVYAVPYVGDDAEDSVADSGTSVPVLFGDAFVATVAKAPLYYALLGIPEDIDDFLSDDLGVDVAAARAAGEVVRAGAGDTGISRSEFLAERFDLQVRVGSVWQIFSGEGGADALIADPLSTPDSEERELVFTLPNGLLGHVLADGDGQLSEDSALTLDTNQNNFRALVAVSYFRLRAEGVAPSDRIRQLSQADGRFTPAELAQIRALYPSAGELRRIVAADRAPLESALAGVGIDIDADPEPISQLFAEFDADVDLDRAAGDLLIDSAGLQSNLALLDPALAVLGGGGFVDRDDFSVFYRQSLCILSVVNENLPDPGICQ